MFCGRPPLGINKPSAVANRLKRQICLKQGGHTFQNVSLQMPFDYEAAGPGWVWDFTELEVLDSTVIEVQDFDNADFFVQLALFGAGPDHFYPFLNIPDFGEAGEGFELPIELDDVMGYHQVSNGSYNQVGLGINLAGFELPVVFDDIDEVHPVPLTADASLESTASYAIDLDIPVTLTYAVDQQRNSTVDGYGTLLLPDGTSHEVLRLKSTVVSNDSVYVEFEGEGQGQSFVRKRSRMLGLATAGCLGWKSRNSLAFQRCCATKEPLRLRTLNPLTVWWNAPQPLIRQPNPRGPNHPAWRRAKRGMDGPPPFR